MDLDKIFEKCKEIKNKTFLLSVQKSNVFPRIIFYIQGSNFLDYLYKNGEWLISLDFNYGYRKALGKIKSYKKVEYNPELWKELPQPFKDFIEKINKIFKESLKTQSIKFITSKVKELLKISSNIMIKPYSSQMFKNIEVPMHHRAEFEDYGDDLEWKEDGYNYRLNYPIETIYYAFSKQKVIAHLGLTDENQVRAVFVDPDYRQTGVATKLYKEVFKRNLEVFSDDPSAMEPKIKSIWEKLLKEMPKNIKKMKDGSFKYTA